MTRLVIVDGTNESLISFLLNGRHDSTRHDSTRLEHNQSCLSDLEVSARITRAPALEPALVLVGQARVVVVGLFSFTLPLHCFSLYSSHVLFSSLYFATPIHFSPPLPSRSFPTSLGGSENRMLCWCCLSFRCRIRRDPQRPKKNNSQNSIHDDKNFDRPSSCGKASFGSLQQMSNILKKKTKNFQLHDSL